MVARLSNIINNINVLTELCKTLLPVDWTREQRLLVETNVKKLERLHSRFSSELNEYFRLSSEPSADDISRFSTSQLLAEEVLVELTVKLENSKGTSETSHNAPMQMSSKLPKLNLPLFDGDILQWQQFWDHFSSNIDQRNISDVDKLLYLKSSVRGEAKKTIDGFETTNKNYQIAVTTLKERFGKESRIIDAHYAALYRIQAADNTSAECRRALNEIERHIRVLHSLGENINHNHLRFMMIEKFPAEVIYEMKMAMKTDTIDDMRKQLEIIVAAREEATRILSDRSLKETPDYTVKTLMGQDSTHTTHVKGNRKFHPREQRGVANHFENQHSHNQHASSQSFNKNLKKSLPVKPYHNMKNNHNKVRNKRQLYNHDNFRPGVTNNKQRKLHCIFCKGNHLYDQCTQFKTGKERKAKLGKSCFMCLRTGHFMRDCRSKGTCFYCGVYGQHHKALCPKKFGPETNKVVASNTFHLNSFATTVKSITILQTAVVTLMRDNHKTRKIKCRLLMDSGSQRSYITQKIVKALNLHVEEENHLSVFTFGTSKPQEYYSQLVRFLMITQTGQQILLRANAVPTISQDIPYPKDELSKYRNELILADDGSLEGQVDLLIGNDYYFTLMSTEKRKVKENLYLINSDLGWILSGKCNLYEDINEVSIVTYFQSNETKLCKPDLPLSNVTLKTLWDLESIGITDSPNTTKEEEAVKTFNDTTKFKDGRYWVSWPWKTYPPDLPTNKGLVQGRLISLLRRMNKDALLSYNDTIQEQLTNGIIEEVPFQEIFQSQYPIHYLAHHGVRSPGKPTRVVYDGSAKLKDSRSLNECLHAGPMLLEDLTGILIRFRSHKIALSADVEKAFLQIALKENSRDVTRFLWLKDIFKPATEDNILHLRFCRVPFGIISSPFLLNAIIKHHLMKSKNKPLEKLAGDIYVDNLITGTRNTFEAISLYKSIKAEFKSMSMNIREWATNSTEVKSMIPDVCTKTTIKVLGLDWNTEKDIIQLRTKGSNYDYTKRGVLRTIASIYDPCGFAVPSLLESKLFLQELWKTKAKWDSTLSEEMTEKWKVIHKDLQELQVNLPRYYIHDLEKQENQLHCFTDASSKAYAAVVYIINKTGKAFVMGKSRLTPIKNQDNLKIPRLELLGVLIGSRLLKYVETSLQMKIKEQYLWTDSQIVIDWIRSQKLLTPFVTRRVEEIKKNPNIIIRYVPTDINPADVATRPMKSTDDRNYWLQGPDFLLQNSANWPTNTLKGCSFFSCDEYLSVTSKKEVKAPSTGKTIKENQGKEESRDKIENKAVSNTIKELMELQSTYFPEEIEGKETNLRRNLGLFKDIDGLLRCKGRLKNSNWSYDKRYPILIPKDCEFTNKIIIQTHQDNYHVGANHTLSIIRQNYWIPQGKSQIQKILRKCSRCIKHGGGPFKLPPTPALPAERVNYSAPFTYTGLDYLGPIIVETKNGTEKRWVCLFTCLAVRALHLEIVQDLSAEEGLLAVRRMISTRGIPEVITSDNASQFKLISEILGKPYCIQNNIKWKFIPQLAPWFGGFYERLVGLVKHCLKRTLAKHLLNDSQMITVTKEIEAVLNSRPLTCVDSEIIHILKPVDFLSIGRCITTQISEDDIIKESTKVKTDLIKGWKKALKIREEFIEMFLNRYLPSLRERYNSARKEPRIKSHSLIPKVGQIVQMRGDTKNRENWKVGKIISLHKSDDGFCRTAKIKVGCTEFTRSISQLYPLEIEEDMEFSDKIVNKKGHYRVSNDSNTQLQDSNKDDRNIIIEELEDRNMQEGHVRINIPYYQDTIPEMGRDEIEAENENENVEVINKNDAQNHDINKVEVQSIAQPRIRREAATKALEKIREWTRNLLNIF